MTRTQTSSSWYDWVATVSCSSESYTVRRFRCVIKALRGLSSQMATLPMYSLVVFAGDCELKDVTFIPHDSYLATFYRSLEAIYDIIESHPPINYTDRWEVANILKAAVERGSNVYLQEQHVYDIHDMLGTNRRYE